MRILAKAARLYGLHHNRNRYILNREDWPAKNNRVNLNWWMRSYGDGDRYNLGDWLSKIIVDEMLTRKGLSADSPVKGTRHLAAIGSVLLWKNAYQDITVWGSGLLTDGLGNGKRRMRNLLIHHLMHRVDVRSVRGPETGRLLRHIGIRCPEIYGDPAILLPEFYTPQTKEMRAYNIIPHHSDRAGYSERPEFVDIITDDWQATVSQICSAKLNICGSLHALIISEAYGIPAILLLPDQGGKKKPTTLLKYKDYYLSTERAAFPIASTVEEALSMEPAPLPELEALRKKQMEVFPYDLWK